MKVVAQNAFSWQPSATLTRSRKYPTRERTIASRVMLYEDFVGASVLGQVYQTHYLRYYRTGNMRPAHYPYVRPALKKELRKMHRISCLLLTATKWNAVKKFYRQDRRRYYGGKPDII